MGPLWFRSNPGRSGFFVWGEAMPQHYLRALRADNQSSDGPIAFIASTEEVASDGLIIAAEGWDLKRFKSNPLVLWAHDWFGNRPPIGKADASIDKEARVLRAEVTFDQGDPFAVDIERKYREGFLNAVSVGFDIKELNGKAITDPGAWVPAEGGKLNVVTKSELLEISAVPIPADPKALAERQQRGYADLSDILRSLATPDSSPEPSEFVWPGVAALMARCYMLDTSDDDETREAEHRRLSREYRALGKEPPEFLTRSQLTVLEERDIRDLFLAGEGELLGWQPDGARAGAVLSSRNRGDVEQAYTLLGAVLERSRKAETDDDAPPTDAERAFLAQIYEHIGAPDVFLRRLAETG